MEKKSEFGAWLYKKYWDWVNSQLEAGQENGPDMKSLKRTMNDFCHSINMSPSSFSEYINHDRKPTRKTIYELSKVYGDEVYEITGIPKPDPNLQMIIKEWDTLSKNKKEKIVDIIYSKGDS